MTKSPTFLSLVVCMCVLDFKTSVFGGKKMNPSLLVFALLINAAISAWGQTCPRQNETGSSVPSAVLALEGKLVFHDGLRRWFELKLDHPECGQPSIELVRARGDSKPLEILRGCRVRSSGQMDFSSTGYFSLDTYQDVEKIKAVGACAQKAPFPDYSHVKPDPAVHFYRVDMHIRYTSGDHPLVFYVSNSGKVLQPWQAYASYDLTGGFALYGHCGKGFVVERVFGTPQAKPGHFDESGTPEDMAMFDPETAAESGVRDLRLGYTCKRIR